MARKYIWTPAKYKAALRGDTESGVKGLRSLAYGFEPSDGFNLHEIDSWTPAQKRKIRETFNKVEQLEPQPKITVRPRSGKKLKQLQESFHGDVKAKKFKSSIHSFPRSEANEKRRKANCAKSANIKRGR